MTPYILIIMLATGSTQGGLAVTTQEFNGSRTCEAAKDFVLSASSGLGAAVSPRIIAICVVK